MRANRFTARPPALLLVACLFGSVMAAGFPVLGGEPTSLADIVPPDTLLYFQFPNYKSRTAGFEKSVLHAVCQNPEMSAFLEDAAAARQRWVAEIAQRAKLEPAFVESLFRGQISIAILDVVLDAEGDMDVSAVVSVQLEEAPDQRMVFEAVRAFRWVTDKKPKAGKPNHREAKLRFNPTVKEAPIGDHDVMMVMSQNPMRFMVLGRTILFYRAPKRDALKVIVANYDNRLTAKTLAKAPLYRAIFRGTQARAGTTFLYANVGRLYALLGAVRNPKATRLVEALGLNSVQALGMAGGLRHEGTLHTLYLYAPGERRGLLKTLSMKSNAELAAMELPADTSGMLAARVNVGRLYREIPALADAVEKALHVQTPIGLSSLAGQQKILGVPASEVLAPLGDAIIVQPGPAGTALRCDTADWAAFEEVVARMKIRGRPARFSATQVTTASGVNYSIKYFNRSGMPLPFAPSYCVTRKRKNGTGTLYLATHPQVIKAILRQATTKSLQDAPDYKRVSAGMGQKYGVFLYLRNQQSYARVYDWLLPLLNAGTALPWFKADPGKLPPGQDVAKHLFGCGLGVRNSADGVTFTAYGPIGVNGFLVSLIDELVIANPTVLGAIVLKITRWHGAETGATAPLSPEPRPQPTRPRKKSPPAEEIPGIGG